MTYNTLIRNNSVHKTIRTTVIVTLLACSLASSSCKKFIEVDSPPTNSTSLEVYKNDATAAAVLTGIYTEMSKPLPSGGGSLSSFMTTFPGLSADELELFPLITDNYIFYYANNLNNRTNPNVWSSCYPTIFTLNSAIEGLNSSTTLNPAIKKQLLGESYFLRAFYYFYLVNLYGDVPLITSVDYTKNAEAKRTPVSEVYAQIIKELIEAEGLLSTNYLNADITTTSIDRVRPTRSAAQALLARVYLYTNDNTNAEIQATKVIQNSMYNSNIAITDIFKKNSSEAIWQLQPVNIGRNTEEAFFFILPSAGPGFSNPVYLSKYLLDSIEAGDKRRNDWIKQSDAGGKTYYYAYKYTSATQNASVTEFQMVLRLSEQFLIRSEARAKLGKVSGTNGALEDLNQIRRRAGLPDYLITDPTLLINKILHERKIELFCEWGHRWLDIKRTGMVNNIMSVTTPAKGGTWDQRKQFYPIPATDILANPNLIQNPSYE